MIKKSSTKNKNLSIIKLKCFSNDSEAIKNTYNDIVSIAVKNNVEYTIIHLPTKIKKWTLIKSPFVYKTSKEQFEMRIYKSVIQFYGEVNMSLFLSLNISPLVQINIEQPLKKIDYDK